MKHYEVFPARTNTPFQLSEFEVPALADREVAVAIKAVSLNYRDLLVSKNTYFSPISAGRVPCSDGAGEVIAIGMALSAVPPCGGCRPACSRSP